MTRFRRILGLSMLAALAAFAGMAAGSCAKNSILGQGLDQYILVRAASPAGLSPDTSPDSAYKWAVNSIDSIIFGNDIDSTALEVTTFQLVDSLGRLVPGTVRFVPGNAYIHYTEDFPSNAFAFTTARPPLATTMSKVYFVPDQPLHGHSIYTYVLTAGVRVRNGSFVRDRHAFSFVTGDSVAPPNPIWPERPGDFH